jgi:FkbM family methyltransferase
MMKLKDILPEGLYCIILSFYNRYFNSFISKCYSQEGEDLILQRFFGEKRTGFYIDIGAHHPKRFSNTYIFYKKGWRGINVEPRPGSKKYFDKVRTRDINIEAAIGTDVQKLSYFMFNEPALNTFSQANEAELLKDKKYKLIKRIDIQTTTLKNICDTHLPPGVQIDFLTIDTEGYDYNVLLSNDWEKYRPHLILVEDKEFKFEDPYKSKVFNFLYERNYRLAAKTFNTLIFQKIIN